MAFKPSEDDATTQILRCYECQGQPAELDLGDKWAIVASVNLLEETIDDSLPQTITISPWKITTLKIQQPEP